MLNQKTFVLWFTGLPCSGKTTLSNWVRQELNVHGLKLEQLDGDEVRRKKHHILGFSREDRLAHVADVVSQASEYASKGVSTLVSLITPYQVMRDEARARLDHFVEIYVRCALDICESRDVKGMYRLAREGKVKYFTGISDPYEEPAHPDLIVDTDVLSIQGSVNRVISYLKEQKLIETSGKKVPIV